MTYYGNYYDHQSEYDDEQSAADRQTDLYSGYNTQFRPSRHDDAPMMILDYSSRHTKMNRRRASFVNQDFNYLPENSYNYQQPRNSRRHTSYINGNSVASPDEYQPYYHDHQQQAGRWGSHHSNNQDHDYPITPENEDQSAALYQNDGLYVVPESQNSEVTLEEDEEYYDDDDMSFIEDETTQRNTLINSESSAPVTDSYDQKQTMSPSSVGDVVSPPASPSSSQQQQEEFVNQRFPNVAVDTNKPAEKKKWLKCIIKTALIIKKSAQKFKRRDNALYNGNVSPPSIQVISASSNVVLGDVLNSRQQQELITQLSNSPSPTPGNNNANLLLPEKTKITSLDRIWVFRLQEEEASDKNVAWIGFDFENQLKIEQHLKELEKQPEDGRLALYDSHIRHKTMPVIVAPKDNKGYYFADMDQKELITLEITFIENDHQKVTFVYRV